MVEIHVDGKQFSFFSFFLLIFIVTPPPQSINPNLISYEDHYLFRCIHFYFCPYDNRVVIYNQQILPL